MESGNQLLSFSGHLDVLRKMLIRVICVIAAIAICIFCLKDTTFDLLLAPSEYDFCTYKWIEKALALCGINFQFEQFHIDLIATDLSSQFMTHISTSIYLGLLGASPYIVYELFKFISPALYESERKYSIQIVVAVYLLFVLGILMSYYVLFPISFRFLGTYSVASKIHSTITLDSYIGTFTTLTVVMGLVFQLPIIALILSKLGFINSLLLCKYRKHAFLLIAIIAAIITPPDVMTLILVTIPLYLLYEVSIRIVKLIESRKKQL